MIDVCQWRAAIGLFNFCQVLLRCGSSRLRRGLVQDVCSIAQVGCKQPCDNLREGCGVQEKDSALKMITLLTIACIVVSIMYTDLSGKFKAICKP